MPSPSWPTISKKSSSAPSPNKRALGNRLFSHQERTGHPVRFFVLVSLVKHLLPSAYFTAAETATSGNYARVGTRNAEHSDRSSIQSPTYAQTHTNTNLERSCHHGNGCRHITRIQPRRSPCSGCCTTCTGSCRSSPSSRSRTGRCSGTRTGCSRRGRPSCS